MISAALERDLVRAARVDRLLVVSDYDGTLAAIVDDPDAATPWPPAWRAFLQLAGMRGVTAALVSGRTRAMLAQLTEAPEGVILVGSHGLEMDDAGPGVPDGLDELMAAFGALAVRHPGALVEHKPAGAAFHYRRVEDDRVADEAARTASQLGARVIHGKKVVEAMFGETDKGEAVQSLRERTSADSVVFLGDDTTDEHVFVVLGDDDVSVKVGDGETAARHRVADPDGVATALRVLVESRRS